MLQSDWARVSRILLILRREKGWDFNTSAKYNTSACKQEKESEIIRKLFGASEEMSRRASKMVKLLVVNED